MGFFFGLRCGKVRSMSLNRVIGIIIAFIILAALVFGLVMLVRGKFFPAKKTVTSGNVSTDGVVSVPATESAQLNQGLNLPATGNRSNGSSLGSSTKAFQVDNVTFNYPQNWGVLSCTNSKNFEFDPVNGADSRIVCDRALKPITVLVDNSLGCAGETVNINGLQVIKSRIENARGVDYRWCFSAQGKSFNLTHRVSGTAGRGLSKDDFSEQIEQVIGSINSSRGGS